MNKHPPPTSLALAVPALTAKEGKTVYSAVVALPALIAAHPASADTQSLLASLLPAVLAVKQHKDLVNSPALVSARTKALLAVLASDPAALLPMIFRELPQPTRSKEDRHEMLHVLTLLAARLSGAEELEDEPNANAAADGGSGIQLRSSASKSGSPQATVVSKAGSGALAAALQGLSAVERAAVSQWTLDDKERHKRRSKQPRESAKNLFAPLARRVFMLPLLDLLNPKYLSGSTADDGQISPFMSPFGQQVTHENMFSTDPSLLAHALLTLALFVSLAPHATDFYAIFEDAMTMSRHTRDHPSAPVRRSSLALMSASVEAASPSFLAVNEDLQEAVTWALNRADGESDEQAIAAIGSILMEVKRKLEDL
jgi:hypothetical protein